jgi:hypothetical protein
MTRDNGATNHSLVTSGGNNDNATPRRIVQGRLQFAFAFDCWLGQSRTQVEDARACIDRFDDR